MIINGIKPDFVIKIPSKAELIYTQPIQKSFVQEQKRCILFPYNTAVQQPLSVIQKAIVQDRQRLLRPIKSDEEYKKRLNEILNYTFSNGVKSSSTRYILMKGYENVEEDLKGLVPYCGEDDISSEINCWLSARSQDGICCLSDKKMANIVDVLDYSLKKCDEKFGKFKGTVYRNGYFNPNESKQYYSSSFSPLSAINFYSNSIPSEKRAFAIIRIKNGHNLYEFQKSAKSEEAENYADIEKEILIDRKSNFRLIKEENYTKKDTEEKEKFLAQAILKKKNVSKQEIEKVLKNNKDLLKYISIWEEV